MALDRRLRDALRAEAESVDLDVERALEAVRRRPARRAPIHPVAFAALAAAVAAVLVIRAGAIAPLGAGPTRPGESGPSAGLAPQVCQLIVASELSAIVGSPVTLSVPESNETTASSSTSSCIYEYGETLVGGGRPNVILSITRYADPGSARAVIEPGIAAHGSIGGLGDAAIYIVPGPLTELMVLKGADVIAVGGLSPTVDLQQMEAVARIILASL